MKLYVVRHGEVPSNVDKLISGCNDEELTENGINQALKIREQLKDIKDTLIPVIRIQVKNRELER